MALRAAIRMRYRPGLSRLKTVLRALALAALSLTLLMSMRWRVIGLPLAMPVFHFTTTFLPRTTTFGALILLGAVAAEEEEGDVGTAVIVGVGVGVGFGQSAFAKSPGS